MKIVSGGQTGVGQGALEAALALGLEIGGWAPTRWLAEKPLGAVGSLVEEFQMRRDGLGIIHV